MPSDSEEAWQVLHLHGKSVDLAIIHREGPSGETVPVGEKLVARIKADPLQNDLPMIMTSERWTDRDCSVHQNGENGVNAYLRYPFTEKGLFDLIQDVMGSPIQQLTSVGSTQAFSSPLAVPAASATQASPPALQPTVIEQKPSEKETKSEFSETILEDSSSFLLRSEPLKSNPSIQFELPSLEMDPGEESPQIRQAQAPTSQPSQPLQSQPAQPLTPEISDHPLEIEVELAPEGFENYPSVPFQMLAPKDLEAPAAAVEAEVPLDPVPQIEVSPSVKADPGPDSNPNREFNSESNPDQDPDLDPEPEASSGSGSFEEDRPEPQVSLPFSASLGDAVVPGGAAHSPDLETVKKYLLLREQDVAVLSNQLKAAKNQISLLEKQLRDEKAAHVETTHLADSQKRKIDDLERSRSAAEEELQSQVLDLNFQLKAKSDKIKLLESQLRDSKEELERFKDRVRSDIRKIRVREKELENRLEILKKDSETLISSRENKLIELKRKLDLMEFNMDLLQEQYTREKEESAKLREKLEKAAQIIKMAGGLLEPASPGVSPVPSKMKDP